jgi:glycosyltransferase involved in cell wall biosynthesis
MTPHLMIYTDDPASGGVAQYNHAVLLALAAEGYRVSCVQSFSDSPMTQAQRAAGVTHHWLGFDTLKDFARTLTEDKEPGGIFDEVRPDLIIFSDCSPLSNLAARHAAMQRGIPFIVVVGFVGTYLAERFAKCLGVLAAHYRAARAVVAVSRENLELLRTHFGLPSGKGQVIHYGRPEKFFAPRDLAVRERLRDELGLPQEAVLCFTSARLARVKGYLYQVVAAKHLMSRPVGERLHFAWAGAGH